MATINLGNIRFNWRGEYSETITYFQDDVVGCNGSSYIAKKTTRGISTADRNIWDLMVAGAEKPYVIGEQKLMPFRASELPSGWYFRNGDNYLLDSQQGRALDSLSANYKEDYKITIKVINGKQYINVPSAFSHDGRGYFERPVNGNTRQVGSIENDAIRDLYGEIHHIFHWKDTGPNGVFRKFRNSDGSGLNNRFYPVTCHMSDSDYPEQMVVFNASWFVPTANENRPINIGTTPAIYLGV